MYISHVAILFIDYDNKGMFIKIIVVNKLKNRIYFLTNEILCLDFFNMLFDSFFLFHPIRQFVLIIFHFFFFFF